MGTTGAHDVQGVGREFRIYGDFVDASLYGSGHINDTYAAVYSQGGTPVRYIHQRINQHVFRNPAGLMENVAKVTEHLHCKLQTAGVTDISRHALTLVPTRDGKAFALDREGNTWRTYVFVERARTFDAIETERQAYEAAKAFGRFQTLLTDLPGPRLTETIPAFHNTRARFDALQQAVDADVHNRAAEVVAEIEFAAARERTVDVLLDLQRQGELPERITHNDTKLNNVMIDDDTGEAICVIDLDTVMPGLTLYDFGDMVRSATRPTPEDEQDLSRVAMVMPMYEATLRGYLEAAGSMLTPAERRHLAFSACLITFEIGIRFLTDYLDGDRYFKTHRNGHNLDRCRVQFKMLRSMEENLDAMERLQDRI